MKYEIILNKLSKSKFRNSFHLNNKMKDYVNDKGIETIKKHAFDFINMRLKPSYIEKDGKQTPYRGHPIFIAQHACGCCCRGCLEKWHHIKKNKELTDNEVEYIVNLLIEWVKKEINL